MSQISTHTRLTPALLLTTMAIFLSTGALAVLATRDRDTPGAVDGGSDTTDPMRQPIAFSHARHVGQVGLDCQFCHAYARRGPVAGIPSVQRCVGCHRTVLSEQPEIMKVLKFWENETPVPWVRVHDLPDYVRFAHKPHIRAGVDCERCHGNVAEMDAAVQVESLSMGWCVSCHEYREVTRDCLACHY